VATRRVVTRVDDLDGSPDAHTVRFGLDGAAYEIDLTDAHAQQFRELLARYVSAGGRLTRSGRLYTRIDLDTRVPQWWAMGLSARKRLCESPGGRRHTTSHPANARYRRSTPQIRRPRVPTNCGTRVCGHQKVECRHLLAITGPATLRAELDVVRSPLDHTTRAVAGDTDTVPTPAGSRHPVPHGVKRWRGLR
jgi:Lsr2